MFGFPFGSIGRLLGTAVTFAVLASLGGGAAGAQTLPLEKRGAEIDARLTSPLSSKTSPSGTPFTLTVVDTLFNHHPELHGATVDGHLEDVVAASPAHRAAMNVIFDDIRFPDGSTEPIDATVKNMSAFEPHTHHLRDMGIIIGSAVVGHIVSKKTGHGGGTLAGAAAGFALVSALKSDITIRSGTLVKLKLLRALAQPA